MGFLKPHIDRPGILDPKPGDPQGFVTNDGMWAAIPLAGKKKGFVIIHNGSQVKVLNTYKPVSYTHLTLPTICSV